MSKEKIHIRFIDGVEVYIPIEAKFVNENQYEILNDEEYQTEDPTSLAEFFPGDIIELEPKIFSDGSIGKVAKSLIKKGSFNDRSFLEFKFKVTIGELHINKETATKYNNELSRIKKEKSIGKFIYPAILEALKKLEN
jgi:hypothetical protein